MQLYRIYATDGYANVKKNPETSDLGPYSMAPGSLQTLVSECIQSY